MPDSMSADPLGSQKIMSARESLVDGLRAITTRPSSWPFTVIAGTGYWLTTTGFFVSNNLGLVDSIIRVVVFSLVWNCILTLVLQGAAVLAATVPSQSPWPNTVAERLVALLVPL
jgi:hypothetical protein